MYFHIILTERCNSQCRYCYGKSMQEFDNSLENKFEFDFSAPCDSEINIGKLKEFLEKDPEPKLIFYGGEPLVQQEKIIQIINVLENSQVEFFMQTNGKLLDKFPKEHMNKFKRILVSCDGDKERTDFNRGEGTYEKVIQNLKLIRENGYKNEIVARMTISASDGFTDLTKQIKHLFSLDLFDSVHWQLDMGFYKFDFNKTKIEKFVQEYNKEISKLLNYWLQEMKKGIVLKIYPFLGIFDSVYNNKKTKLRCGSGYANYTITTNGQITCCPIMNSIKNFYVGDIETSNPKNLKEIYVSDPCGQCEYLDLCGGRCLYSNYAKLWPKEGEELICKTIKHLIDEIKRIAPEIKELSNKNIISEQQFEYEKYFGPEIIP